jgi:hypothetical protein
MGEPERRRRRLRPHTSAAPAEASPATGTAPADKAESVTGDGSGFGAPDGGGNALRAPEGGGDVLRAPEGGGAGAPPFDEQTSTSPIENPVQESPKAAPRSTRAGLTGRPTRSPGTRPTSGAGAVGDDREMERGLRGLVGSGSSQVSVGAALRARDAARPTEEQLAEAERALTIVRRNWTPREDLPRNR